MVLLYEVDGKTSIYRNVVSGKNLQEHIEGFLSMRNYHRNGSLYQLIGKERRLLRKFGTMTIKHD